MVNSKTVLRALGLILSIAILFLLLKKEPKPEIKTETVYIHVIDTIERVQIEKVPFEKPVYIYEDSIVYITQETKLLPDKPITKANEFKAKVETEGATANLSILTTGRLLDVQGVINYEKEITTVKETKYINKNNMYLYGQASAFPFLEDFQVGIDYTIKNKIIVGTSLGFDSRTSSGSVNLKIGIKIF